MNILSEEEKALLLQVICEGYPHGLMVNYDGVPYDIATIGHNRVGLIKPFMSCITDSPFIEDVRPYLRDIADMTEEEEKEFNSDFGGISFGYNSIEVKRLNWLIKKHFNYKLPSHLYIKVTKKNNPYRTLT